MTKEEFLRGFNVGAEISFEIDNAGLLAYVVSTDRTRFVVRRIGYEHFSIHHDTNWRKGGMLIVRKDEAPLLAARFSALYHDLEQKFLG